ncbi:MAG: ASKHA domain-containing protein [Candidatus Thorarchaeota archaeon]
MSDYGIAVDIGTTTVSLSLFDKVKGKRVKLVSFKNPQSQFGEDVISRIKHQDENRDVCDLSLLIRESISAQITKLLKISQIQPSKVSDVVIVGNTPMHHLFFDLPTSSLLKEPYTIKHTESIVIHPDELGIDLPEASCYAPPLIESFVGSDALGVIIGFGLANNVDPSLTLDIGTNSEIIVQAYEKIWVASAASGPAFEGMSLSCGMIADKGAIDRVEYQHSLRTLSVNTIGNISPTGICGVGAISALHEFRRANWITKEGSINRNILSKYIYNQNSVYGILIDDTNTHSPIYLTQLDIRLLQQSKAAIRTVIDLLFEESNCDSRDIRNLHITGAFGNGLDVNAAVHIGMIPALHNLRGTLQKLGGALLGAELIIWFQRIRSEVDEIYKSIKYVDMMSHPQFSELHSKYSLFP